jgi:hypothetical protein
MIKIKDSHHVNPDNPVILSYNHAFMSIPFIEENDQTAARHEHLEALRQLVGNVYPNKFERSRIVDPGKEDTITAIVEQFRDFQPQEELNKFSVRLAGHRYAAPRDGQSSIRSSVRRRLASSDIRAKGRRHRNSK